MVRASGAPRSPLTFYHSGRDRLREPSGSWIFAAREPLNLMCGEYGLWQFLGS
jgi:hypothetical protein